MNTKKLLKEMTMKDRYNTIQQFRHGAFKVLNQSLPQLVKQDILLSLSTLEVLKDIKAVIEDDIKKLKLENINIEHIVATYREDELSDFIAMNVYLWTMGILERDYKAHQKAEKLNRVFSIESRKKELSEIEVKIKSLEESIEVLIDLDARLVKAQLEKLEELRNRKDAIEGTLHYKTEEEIKLEAYGCTYRYLENVLNNVQANIDHIERNLA
nr:hypothetical protein [uncultured Clostridium sp.]